MSLTLVDGWVAQARCCQSPHFNARPLHEVSLLVIHNISLPAGCFGQPYIDQLFQGCLDIEADTSFKDLQGLEVSAHFLIRRDGELVQYVSCDDRAWHAGVSEFEGRSNCNDFALGIELEGTDALAYSEEQYLRLIELTRSLMVHYPDITLARITGHSDIAPGRKTDPGNGFDWQRYKAAL
ncbi:1,6-anhydro-N-acetylmuramyl-L-alanine amidase AmpD [Shewanella pealeana]|uniref:1,6-anhydro-N-acetylmuramyl-L-alanine amidase AmpD n=1 Tax=Shewanella pealeana (strain ATCC 700345 / ANG-SQ1) TaxID=398579 RepID=A8GZK7_SHEPA|nr:1,6-anhydro-N-acetylmuramyl-L-alanine amidase AmpD [Shewanella pealeana]ABV85744.1 N-acetylmuramyl-L-alanine amidase, negative regulator of AmpC, AmpD [Shewanella pealeana ATCC 700345]